MRILACSLHRLPFDCSYNGSESRVCRRSAAVEACGSSPRGAGHCGLQHLDAIRTLASCPASTSPSPRHARGGRIGQHGGGDPHARSRLSRCASEPKPTMTSTPSRINSSKTVREGSSPLGWACRRSTTTLFSSIRQLGNVAHESSGWRVTITLPLSDVNGGAVESRIGQRGLQVVPTPQPSGGAAQRSPTSRRACRCRRTHSR